jgi:spore maturation protein CgeB
VKVAIVGSFGGTHIGGSLARAAPLLGIEAMSFDAGEAHHPNRAVRAFMWRFADRRPFHLARFGDQVMARCSEYRPDVLIATGAAPLNARTLRALRDIGIICINYSTDDPWNAALSARWYLHALPEYGRVFSTRRSNMADLEEMGCAYVDYLPFGYDASLFAPPSPPLPDLDADVLFVGGADRDRLSFVTELIRYDIRVALVGGYWNRFSPTRSYALGLRQPEELCILTAAAKINLCLVRRANRDGHVMRSLEIAAIGGCMLVEDTAEHREMFGAAGEAVVYFATAADAARQAKELLANPDERVRLSCAVHTRISNGGHSYADRLLTMLGSETRAQPVLSVSESTFPG